MFIAYQISTEHVQALRRWQSYKAYWILNALEVVFWTAVTFLIMQANLARCVGVGCKLSWVVMGLSIVLRYVRSPDSPHRKQGRQLVRSADFFAAPWHLT
jgi:hypothetical protein